MDASKYGGEEATAKYASGEWSEERFEAWAVAFFHHPTAPFIDMRRYTKGDPLALVVVETCCAECKVCTTPTYRKRRPRVFAKQPA